MAVETIFGTDGNDNITGTSASELILAGCGDDWVVSVDGLDTILGESGNDSIFAYSGGMVLLGGDGDDQLVSSDQHSDLISVLRGGLGNDSIFATGKISHSYGGEGDDLVSVNVLHGGTAKGGLGQDTLSLRFYDEEFQISNEDTIVVLGGPDAGVQVGAATFLHISGFESLTIDLGAGDDRVKSGDLDDRIGLASGSNIALAMGGDDYVSYRTGGANRLDGGLGRDTLLVNHVSISDRLIFGVTGETAFDLYGSEIEGFENYTVWGGTAGDYIKLGEGKDEAQGGFGSDMIRGGGGDDDLAGDRGQDTIWGGEGADRLIGGLGADRLRGGHGADEFCFTALTDAGDRIEDFKVGEDVLCLNQSAIGKLLPKGSLDETHFNLGAASGSEAQFIYRTNSTSGQGALVWDSNGTGAGGETVLAYFDNMPGLLAGSILIF